MTNKKMLIVEDQEMPLRAIENAVNGVCPRYFSEMHCDVVKCYSDASRKIEDGYDIILLDHRLPVEDMGDSEIKDFHRFSDALQNIGYTLIGKIRKINPKTVIIGTSSLSKRELQEFAAPDYTMSKMPGEAERDLESILIKIMEETK